LVRKRKCIFASVVSCKFFSPGLQGMWGKCLAHCKVGKFYGFANSVGDCDQTVACSYKEGSGEKHAFI